MLTNDKHDLAEVSFFRLAKDRNTKKPQRSRVIGNRILQFKFMIRVHCVLPENPLATNEPYSDDEDEADDDDVSTLLT